MSLPNVGSPFTESDAEFWSRQLQEHAKFLFLLTENNDLARQAKSLDITFEDTRKAMEGKSPQEQLGMLAFPVLKLRQLKVEILNRQLAGEWIGWALPGFVEHLLQELDYFWAKSTGANISGAEELSLWSKFMADHAAFVARLLDPSEVEKFDQALLAQNYFLDLQCSGCDQTLPTLVQLGKQAGQELDQYFSTLGVGTPQLRSAIHPVLAIHIIREGRRFLATLETLQK